MHKCPTCGAFADQKAYPFCSSRCADVDLGRWFQGSYAVPAFDSADYTIVENMLVGSNLGNQEDDECEPRASPTDDDF